MGGGGEVTQLLRAYGAGERDAFDRVVPLVYDELRRIAHRHLRRGPGGHVLDTGALVHEAYLKLAGTEDLQLKDRRHLLAVSARAMRQVIVDHARSRQRVKRGAGRPEETLDESLLGSEPSPEWLIDLDSALSRLRQLDEGLASVFECRFFGGFSEADTAEALGLPLRTAQRGWMRARAWLRAELGEPGRDAGRV